MARTGRGTSTRWATCERPFCRVFSWCVDRRYGLRTSTACGGHPNGLIPSAWRQGSPGLSQSLLAVNGRRSGFGAVLVCLAGTFPLDHQPQLLVCPCPVLPPDTPPTKERFACSVPACQFGFFSCRPIWSAHSGWHCESAYGMRSPMLRSSTLGLPPSRAFCHPTRMKIGNTRVNVCPFALKFANPRLCSWLCGGYCHLSDSGSRKGVPLLPAAGGRACVLRCADMLWHRSRAGRTCGPTAHAAPESRHA